MDIHISLVDFSVIEHIPPASVELGIFHGSAVTTDSCIRIHFHYQDKYHFTIKS
jgi:hypothetical protein